MRAGFLSYEPAGDVRFDHTSCQNALHQIPDSWKVMALRRVAGWLRPGGTLLLRDLVDDRLPDEAEPAFGAWFDRTIDDPVPGYTADDFAEHIRSEHRTFTALLESDAGAKGVRDRGAFGSGRCVGGATCRRV